MLVPSRARRSVTARGGQSKSARDHEIVASWSNKEKTSKISLTIIVSYKGVGRVYQQTFIDTYAKV
ncbi:MAG TPA: hypothetical protein VFQ31_04520, partial [Methyloceanibacter sp.]|nr:hypothetical protein [Methyloceanibacter sp.]